MKTASLWIQLCTSAALAGMAWAAPEAAEYAAVVRLTPLLQTTTTANGQPIQYPKTENPEVRVVMVEIPAGTETGWHKHPMPAYAYVLAGTVTVELEGGKSVSFHAGEAFAEAVDTLHNGKNSGTEAVKILMVVTGEKGKRIAEPAPKPTQP